MYPPKIIIINKQGRNKESNLLAILQKEFGSSTINLCESYIHFFKIPSCCFHIPVLIILFRISSSFKYRVKQL